MKTTSVERLLPALMLTLGFLPCMAQAATHMVTVQDSSFSPKTLTIAVGDTVQWNNAAGGMQHNVTADDGSFNSTTASSFTFSRTFNSPGTVGYNCTIHGSPNSGMFGTITVEAATTPAAELTLTEVSVVSGSYPQGANLSIEAEVENTGNEASGAFQVDFYASTNSSISASDTFLGTDNWASIAASEDASRTFNATIPASLAPGTWFIGGIIDFDDSNSGNNVNLDDEPITVTGSGGSAFQINNTLNDAWYDPDTNGQGFFITVFPDIKKIFVAWFTYDTERPAGNVTAILGEPGHRWLTAFGGYDTDSASLDIELTQGGIFDANPPAPVQSPYGTIELLFNNCNQAELAYDIPSLGLSRSMLIQRTYPSPDTLDLCEALQTP